MRGLRDNLLMVGLLAVTAGGGYLAHRLSTTLGTYMGSN